MARVSKKASGAAWGMTPGSSTTPEATSEKRGSLVAVQSMNLAFANLPSLEVAFKYWYASS
jgi:hypothetical protein